MLAACNPGVFIDEFLSESSDILVKDGEAAVDFKAENWGVLDIYRGSMTSSAWINYSICNLDGTPTSKNLPLGNSDLAAISIQDEFQDIRIEKTNRRRLVVKGGENMEDNATRYVVRVGNEYEWKLLTFVFPPSQKYQIDSVVYQWDAFVCSDLILKPTGRTFKIDNSLSSNLTTIYVRPYEDAFRNVQCFFDNGWGTYALARIFGTRKQEITIPDVADAVPVLGRSRIFLGEESHRLDTDLDRNLEIPATVKAGERRCIEVYLCMEKYSVPFKVYASNPETGRERVFSGSLSSERPFDFRVYQSPF